MNIEITTKVVSGVKQRTEEERPVYDEDDQGNILYSGKARVANIADFALSYDERCKKYDSIRDQEKIEAIISGQCPIVVESLGQHNGRHRKFWSCKNYPHCHFTVNISTETGEIETAGLNT